MLTSDVVGLIQVYEQVHIGISFNSTSNFISLLLIDESGCRRVARGASNSNSKHGPELKLRTHLLGSASEGRLQGSQEGQDGHSSLARSLPAMGL